MITYVFALCFVPPLFLSKIKQSSKTSTTKKIIIVNDSGLRTGRRKRERDI